MRCDCGYDISRSPEICPECGANIAAVLARRRTRAATNFSSSRLHRERFGVNLLLVALLLTVAGFVAGLAPVTGMHPGMSYTVCLALAGLGWLISGCIVAVGFRALLSALLLIIAGAAITIANFATLSGSSLSLLQVDPLLIGLVLAFAPIGAGSLSRWMHRQCVKSGNSSLPAVSRSPANICFAAAVVACVIQLRSGMATSGIFILASIAAGIAATYSVIRYRVFLHALVPVE